MTNDLNQKKCITVCLIFSCFFFQILNAQPIIKSFSPISGPIGTSIKIIGKNFDPSTDKNIVYFGATKAAVVNSTDSSLNVIVPESATYQPITVTVNALTATSKLPFLVTFPGGDLSFQQSSFSKEINISKTSCFNEFDLTDLDNDGIPDVAYTNPCLNTLSIVRNTTIGSVISFASPINVANNNAYAIAIEAFDFDGDGKKDLATANFGENSISVFKNTSSIGSVSFAAPQVLSGGENPYGLTVADLNGDGKPDIIATNEYNFPGTISVFINNSTNKTLSFKSQQLFTVGDEPRRLTTCDLNNDNKPDIIVANQGSGSITVLINTSTLNNISFTSKEYNVTQGASPESVTCGDIDGDGKQDILVANNNENGTISVFKNKSNKTNISFEQNDLPTVSYPYSTVITDLNGDGKPDIAVVSHYGNNKNIYVYKNLSVKGSILFDNPFSYSTFSTHENILAGDVNGDNKPDLIFGNNQNAQGFSILTNNQASVLVVNLFNLKAYKNNNNIELQWQTIDDNYSYFNIERSTDASNFINIGRVDCSTKTNYDYTDNATVNKNLYYRIKRFDKDGNYDYSNIASVSINNNFSIAIYPIPVNDILNITGLDISQTNYFEIVSANGIVVAKRLVSNSSSFKWNVSSLTKGTYYLQVLTGTTKTNIKFLKQ